METYLDGEILDSDIIESRGHGASVGILEDGETFRDPIRANEFNEWIEASLDNHFRRNGLTIGVIGVLLVVLSAV